MKRGIIPNTAMAVASLLLLVPAAGAATYKVLYNFGSNTGDGTVPVANLIIDHAGNLYGTTTQGGSDGGGGTVFELIPAGDGSWTEKVLKSFTPGGIYGSSLVGGLIMDDSGNLFGTTVDGGSSNNGTVFKLAPVSGGGWVETVLYNFAGGRDGSAPISNLTSDGAGNLYGTTYQGGAGNGKSGTVFEVNTTTGNETVLLRGGVNDAETDPRSVIFGSDGNLYGVTRGNYGSGDLGGTVYKLTPAGGGIWTQTILHHFNGNGDGFMPLAPLVFNTAGDLFGTTELGGANDEGNYGDGTVFELSPKESGGWSTKIVHSFHVTSTGGELPFAGLVFDASGNMYTTTASGGYFGHGEVVEFSHQEGGGWIDTVLHDFGKGKDGSGPQSALTMDSAGNLYGVTVAGGEHGEGMVFEITPD